MSLNMHTDISVYPRTIRKKSLRIPRSISSGIMQPKINIVILKIFTDLGISGRKADKRPSFQEMIGLAKGPDHPVDCILVWKFSRFARNQEESIV